MDAPFVCVRCGHSFCLDDFTEGAEGIGPLCRACLRLQRAINALDAIDLLDVPQDNPPPLEQMG